MPDILDDLRDLHKQATTEPSHYYVAKCCERAIEEIESLRALLLNRADAILKQVKENKTILDDATARLDRAGL